MYATSPSWSIPGKKNKQKPNNTPSPSGYFPDKWNTVHAPSWKIGTSKRDKENNSDIPGPGHYQSKKLYSTSKYGKFNHQNHHRVKHSNNPGPNCYSPNYSYTRPTTPSSKIPAKPKQSKICDVPGPGQYQSILKFKNSNPNTKIGNQRRFQTEKLQGPGPESYTPNKDSYKRVSVGFTRQQKNSNSPEQNQLLKVPGPGSYELKDNFYSSLKQNKGFSISTKFKQHTPSQTPGPGKYDPVYDSLPHSPIVSIKGKYREIKQPDTPGPGQYSAMSSVKNQQHGYSIGKSERGSVNLFKNNPGPGQYNLRNFKNETPKYSISGSRVQQNRAQSPGPGTYNPDKNAVKKRPQSAKIGNSKRCQIQKSLNPGPGEYEIRSRPETASNKFSRQVRDKHSTQLSPGPADYKINQIFGHTAPYFKKI